MTDCEMTGFQYYVLLLMLTMQKFILLSLTIDFSVMNKCPLVNK